MMGGAGKPRSSQRKATCTVAFRLMPGEMREIQNYIGTHSGDTAGQLARRAVLRIARGQEIDARQVRAMLFELWTASPSLEQQDVLM